MGRQRRIYHTAPAAFPEDFAERLGTLKANSGLSWSELARRLTVDARTVRRWRNGTQPGSAHLLALLRLADQMGRLSDLWEPE